MRRAQKERLEAKAVMVVKQTALQRMHFDLKATTAYQEKLMIEKQLKLQARANKEHP